MESTITENDYGISYKKNGLYHRDDGPAIEYKKSGAKSWIKNGKQHRLDGPAHITGNGKKYWFINGHMVTREIHQWAKEMNIDLDNLSSSDKFLIRLYWENYNG